MADPRVGLIGYGKWGRNHARTLHRMGLLKIIGDRSGQACADAICDYPGVSVHGNMKRFYDEVDAVVVATPIRTHFDVVSAALDAGKHVLVEKPTAPSRTGTQDLVFKAARLNLALVTGYTFLHDPGIRWIQRLLEIHEFESIVHIHSDRVGIVDGELDVGVLWDTASHDVAIARCLLPGRRTAYWANSTPRTCQLRIEAEFRGFYTARVSWRGPEKFRRLEVVGERVKAIWTPEQTRAWVDGVEEVPLLPQPGIDVLTLQAAEFLNVIANPDERPYWYDLAVDVAQDLELLDR